MVCLPRFFADITSTSHLSRTFRVKFYLTQVSCYRICNLRPFYLCLCVSLASLLFVATEKHTVTGKNSRFAYGLSEMQGWRLSKFGTNFYPHHSSVMAVTRTLFLLQKKITISLNPSCRS